MVGGHGLCHGAQFCQQPGVHAARAVSKNAGAELGRASRYGPSVDGERRQRHRAVDERRSGRNLPGRAEFGQDPQDHLGPVHRERGDDHRPAAPQGPGDRAGECLARVGTVLPVATTG